MTSIPITVFVIDDDVQVLTSLTKIFATRDDLRICGTSTTWGPDVMLELRRSRPTIILLDVKMGDVSGVQILRELRAAVPATAVVMFSAYEVRSNVIDAMNAGAAGFLTKDVAPEFLVSTLKECATGTHVLSATASRLAFHQPDGAEDSERVEQFRTGFDSLDDFKRRIVAYFFVGYSNAQIAAHLNAPVGTVRTYAADALRACGCQSRAAFVALAVRTGRDKTMPIPPPLPAHS